MREPGCTSRRYTRLAAVLITSLALGACDADTEGGDILVEAPRVPIEELSVPNEDRRLLMPAPAPFRAPRDSWDADDIGRFWIAPTEIGVDWLADRSDEEIERILETIE
jgi:hypothetical protein